MSDFWSGEFTFNGISNDDMNVCIVDINNKNLLKDIGSQYELNLSSESSYNGSIYYKEETKTVNPITLQLCKQDTTPFEVNEILTINNWLFQPNFCRFQTEDYSSEYNIVLYLKAISMEKVLNPSMSGYLEYQFQPYSPYAYIIPDSNIILSNGETKTLINYSNIKENYKPIIKVKNLGDTSTIIKIANTTTNNELELEGLDTNEEVTIDCQMGTVINSNGDNRFLTLNNYDFINLIQGNNTISLTGNATVEFVCEYPVIL